MKISSLKIGIKRPVFYIGFLIIVLMLSSPLLITWIINTTYIKNKISSLIYQKTGTFITASKFSLTVFPKASINIADFNFHPDDRIQIKTELMKVHIDIQKLLQGKINIDQIAIHHPVIETIAAEKVQPGLSFDLSISKCIQGLKNIFTFLPDQQASVELTFKNLTSQYFSRMDGSVYLSKETNEILLKTIAKEIKIKISDLLNNSFEKHLDVDSVKIDQLKLTVSLSSEGEIQGQCDLDSSILKSKEDLLVLDSNPIEVSFKLSDNFYQVDIKPFRLNYPKGKVGIHFFSSRAGQAQKKSEIQFTGTGIHIDQAQKMSLLLFKDNKIAATLFNILQEGVVPQVSVAFQSEDLSELFKGTNLKLKGNIKEGIVNIPNTELTASDINGNAEIQKGILEINTNQAMVQKSKIEKGHLFIDLLNHADIPFQGDFSLDLDLSMIPKTLISLLPETVLARELLLVHNVKGHSKARLKLSLAPNTKDMDVKINTADFSVTGRYNRIPNDITLENVNFKYDTDTIVINHITGTINHSRIYDLNAKLDLKNDAKIYIQSGSGTIALDSIIPWLMSYKKTREHISPIKQGNGKVTIDSIELSGPLLKPDHWTYDMTGSGQGINITTHLNQKEIENLSCQYHISDDLIILKKMMMKNTNLSWLDQFFEKNLLDSILVPFETENGNLQLGQKHSLLNSDLQFKSGPILHIDLKGETLSSLALNTIKILDKGFSDAVISFNHNAEKPLFDFNGILNTQTLNKILIPKSSWGKTMDELTEGDPILIYTDKNSTLNIITKKLNLNSILSQSKTFSFGNRQLSRNIINFKTDKLKVKNLTVTDIDSTVSFKKDHSYIKLNKAFLCDIETKGDINLKNDEVHAIIPFEANNKSNIQDLLTCLFQETELMDGRYTLSGNILSDAAKKNFSKTLTGSFVFSAQEGRIYRLTLLSRILSVLNVSSLFKGNIPDITQKGFAYKNISLEADIKESKIYFTKAIIDGNDMTLIFNGWIDPINNTMDLTCLVAPFKTVDLIVEKIPIINTLLGGRLVSIPIKATGNLFDPTVIPLHPSAVGQGLVNMMSDILKTPIKLWDKLSGE